MNLSTSFCFISFAFFIHLLDQIKMNVDNANNAAAAANPGPMLRTLAEVMAGAWGSVLDRAQIIYDAFLAANPGAALRAITEQALRGLLTGLAGGLVAVGGHLLAAVVAGGRGLRGLLGRAGARVADWKKRRAAKKAAVRKTAAARAKFKEIAVNAAAAGQARGPLRKKVAAEAKEKANLMAYLGTIDGKVREMHGQIEMLSLALAQNKAAIEQTDAKVDAIGTDNLNVRGRVGVLEK